MTRWTAKLTRQLPGSLQRVRGLLKTTKFKRAGNSILKERIRKPFRNAHVKLRHKLLRRETHADRLTLGAG